MTEPGRFRQFISRHNLKFLWGVAIVTVASNVFMYLEKKNNPKMSRSLTIQDVQGVGVYKRGWDQLKEDFQKFQVYINEEIFHNKTK